MIGIPKTALVRRRVSTDSRASANDRWSDEGLVGSSAVAKVGAKVAQNHLARCDASLCLSPCSQYAVHAASGMRNNSLCSTERPANDPFSANGSSSRVRSRPQPAMTMRDRSSARMTPPATSSARLSLAASCNASSPRQPASSSPPWTTTSRPVGRNSRERRDRKVRQSLVLQSLVETAAGRRSVCSGWMALSSHRPGQSRRRCRCRAGGQVTQPEHSPSPGDITARP